ncbi:DUF4405 domain-containing protein [Maritimibacter sp. DP1N21-5]|uniref:DUF4405 domain-containing protein n=1 Tax=Maritimibacter sp. DP1N21-5 TaxID=2836867 RepID=UPI001C48F1BC|nr:DUF4405 domain-containing protein [Maritimibacter sp. DP1N21-5]MBV7409236.1 DUF4405 domain-containing protein [Maritimibacter sp. DP1N21-5]
MANPFSSKSLRPWATPLTIATTLVTLVSGVLLFFHLAPGLSRPAHEWIGMVMVAAVAAHMLLNWRAFTTYFKRPLGLGLIAAGVAVTVASMVIPPAQPAGGSPVGMILQAMNGAEVRVLADLAHRDVTEVIAQLAVDGMAATPETTLAQLSGGDRGRQMALLQDILKP